MSFNVGILLQIELISRVRGTAALSGDLGILQKVLTSCSDSEIFWSFILCRPADAEPSSIAAAKRVLFIIATGNI
jgi:hypothetical protein